MKTTINHRFFAKLTAVIVAALACVNLAACTTSEEPAAGHSDTPSVSAAKITFTYTVPEEILKYAEITVCHNNNEGTDAKWFPMLDNKVTVTYDLERFPVTAPLVIVYDTTNRTAYGVDVDWGLTMDVDVTMIIGGEKVTKSSTTTHRICGDLGAGIDDLIKSVLDRTYAVRLTTKGNVEFVHRQIKP